MATNDLLPFGTGVGANVLDQASYSALAGRTAGFSAGTAISAQLNKVWRQSAFASSMLGQFVVDYSGGDSVVDDGNVSNLEASFVKALRSIANISTTGSTTKAPKLIGIVANASGAGTSVPTTTTTNINYGTTVQNDLGTSTWNGTTLTVGTGEAGLWAVACSIEFPTTINGAYATVGLTASTGAGIYQAASTGVSGQAQAIGAATFVKLGVGNTIIPQTYQQSGGTVTSLARQTSQFCAFLISAY